jgi:hypothetical protein
MPAVATLGQSILPWNALTSTPNSVGMAWASWRMATGYRQSRYDTAVAAAS